MPVFQMLCLANSYKEGGRCIAGLRIPQGDWIRPVSKHDSGALFDDQFCMQNGEEVKVLQVVKREFLKPAPSSHQSENWLIDNDRWEEVADYDEKQVAKIFFNALYQESHLFGDNKDRMPWSEDWFENPPIRHSLALIKPEFIEIESTLSHTSSKQIRARFLFRGHNYNLVITDPVWKKLCRELPMGCYSLEDTIEIDPDDRIFLTVSLGEPFKGYVYKLVAAIIKIPKRWNTF